MCPHVIVVIMCQTMEPVRDVISCVKNVLDLVLVTVHPVILDCKLIDNIACVYLYGCMNTLLLTNIPTHSFYSQQERVDSSNDNNITYQCLPVNLSSGISGSV